MHRVITVSTDGSCLRNPGGASGWAWVNHDGSSASGGIASGTNQVAELTAVLEAIRSHPGAENLRIESDSQYAIKCASVWVAGWRRKGWRTASGGPVQNLGLVQAIERAMSERAGTVLFHWVRGHQGDHFNERADELCGLAARAAQRGEVLLTRTTATGEVTVVPAGTDTEPVVEPVAAARVAAARAPRRATVTRTVGSLGAEGSPVSEPELDVLF